MKQTKKLIIAYGGLLSNLNNITDSDLNNAINKNVKDCDIDNTIVYTRVKIDKEDNSNVIKKVQVDKVR